MEYQKVLPFENKNISIIKPVQNQNYKHQFPKFQENRERRMIIEIEKQKKQKNENACRLLQAKYSRDNDVGTSKDCRKTISNFNIKRNIQKQNQIQQKIQKTRAKEYRTHYQQSIRKKIQEKQKRIELKKIQMQRSQFDKCAQFHLRQWKSYEKKLLDKYGGKVQKKNLYDIFLKRQKQLTKFVKKYKENIQIQKQKDKSQTKIDVLNKKVIKKKVTVKKKEQTPIDSLIGLDTLGLSKSMRNPQQILNRLVKFIQNKKSVQQPINDKGLVEKLQFQLYQMQDDII